MKMMMRNKIARPNRQGIIWTVLILVLCFGRPAQADVAAFIGSGCRLDLRVQDITEQRLLVEIRLADIERLRIDVSSDELYGDRFSLRNCPDEFEGKVVSMSGESAILALPRHIVATLEIEPAPGTAGAAYRSEDAEAPAPQTEVTPQAGEMEVLGAVTTDRQRDAEFDIVNALFGSLRGRMLVDGRPYAGCKVKLRRLDTGFVLFAVTKPPRLFDAITDDQGVYRFERLPEGLYDIYWIPPGSDYWVRLLKEKPPVVIGAGAETVQPDINADMKAI